MTVPSPAPRSQSQEELYADAVDAFGAALGRLARSYEADADKREDLLQEIHLAIWISFLTYDARCSLRTWVYRVAHNVATSHVIKQRRNNARNWVSLETLDRLVATNDPEHVANQQMMLTKLSALVQQLPPLDRQIVLLYLEGSDAASIGEITGMSAGNVATKISRIKRILGKRFRMEGGGSHAG